jgi:regulatory protein
VREREEPSRQQLTLLQALAKARHYCAYQERSHREVIDKLLVLGLSRPAADEALAQLISEGFVNEERFARAFAGGRFRMKQWGRLKIENELKARGLSPRCIEAALREIDPAEYEKTLTKLIRAKSRELKHLAPAARNRKTAAYAIQKGYEPELVWRLLAGTDNMEA